MKRRMVPSAVAALFLVGALTSAHIAIAEPAQPERHGLDTKLLDDRLEDLADLVEGSVTVEVRGGKETWTKAIGTRSFDTGAPKAEPNDRVRVGSVTKSMVAAVVLQLDGEGKLDLDDPIDNYLPELLPYEEQTTVRQMLQHTSGVPEWLYLIYPGLAEGDLTEIRENYQTYYKPEELIGIGTEEPLLFEPGTDWSYANTGYLILGLLIEERTGQSLRHELHERIFEPAALDRTYYPRDTSTGIKGPHSVPYVTTGDSDEPYFDATELANSQLGASGAAMSTVGDLNDFYDALIDGTLLTEEQLSEATEFIDTGVGIEYGLGIGGIQFGCSGDPEEVFLGHVGDSFGHHTHSFHSFDGKRQITVAWNIDDKHGYTDPEEFEQALNGLLTAGLCGKES